MSDVLERLLRYVQVSSPSNPDNEEECPVPGDSVAGDP